MKFSHKHADFTGLATNYSLFRPDYAPSVLNGLLGLLKKTINDIDFVDVGAGTGIWTRMVYQKKIKSAIAIEPNEDMRQNGIKDSAATTIQWMTGSAEHTGLKSACCDWLTMASSFHWAQFDPAMKEFARLIRPGGRFTALWNPRLIEKNTLFSEIEEKIYALEPNIHRVSSCNAEMSLDIQNKLLQCINFDDLIYIEGRHTVRMSLERYIGAWLSVNDLQVQLGDEKFTIFIEFVKERIKNLEYIDATYITKAWSIRRK